jgi:hypothetical protein
MENNSGYWFACFMFMGGDGNFNHPLENQHVVTGNNKLKVFSNEY